jgi:hypothetical protein
VSSFDSWLDWSLHINFTVRSTANVHTGKLGSGKTILAAVFIDWLKANFPDTLTCYYFFDSVEFATNDSTGTYRAILSQILQRHAKDDRLLELFSFAMYCGSHDQPTACDGELSELISLCCTLPSITQFFIVLDGLDECDDIESAMSEKLVSLSSISSVKFGLFSRPTVGHWVNCIPGLRGITIGLSNSNDIGRYLNAELTQLRQAWLLPKGLDLQSITQKLIHRMDGMFLWARLMKKI